MKSIDVIKELKQDVEQKTKKDVQMHMLAQNMCLKLEQELKRYSILDLYGRTLMYNKIYMGRLASEPEDCQWVTVEEFMDGEFTKYINNYGVLCGDNTVIRQKCESLAHFSYERYLRERMVVDMQGSRYKLFDPEIDSSTLQKDGEVLFTAGNVSKQAVASKCFPSLGTISTSKCTITEVLTSRSLQSRTLHKLLKERFHILPYTAAVQAGKVSITKYEMCGFSELLFKFSMTLTAKKKKKKQIGRASGRERV